MHETPDDQDYEANDPVGVTPSESIPIDIRDSCADGFRAAVPRLRSIASGEDDSATVHHSLVAASLLARYAVTNPRHVLIVPRDFAEIVGRTVIETLQPSESQFFDFMNTFIDRLHEREDALN